MGNEVGGSSSRKKWQKRWKPEWGNFDENYDTKWYRIDDVNDEYFAMFIEEFGEPKSSIWSRWSET